MVLADLDSSRLRTAGDRAGISHRYRDAAALLADSAGEAVALCVPARRNVNVALAALGPKARLSRKGDSLSLAESNRLINAAAGSWKISQVPWGQLVALMTSWKPTARLTRVRRLIYMLFDNKPTGSGVILPE